MLATMRLCERAARQGVRQFIFASSGSVYGVTDAPRVTEDLELLPISEYNKTKMVAERVILSYGDRMVPTIVRPATVCGLSPRMRLDLTVNLLTMQALTNGAMTVFGGRQVRPNIHIDDLVDLYLFAFDRRLGRRLQRGLREPLGARDRAADRGGGAVDDRDAAVERSALLSALLRPPAGHRLRAEEERRRRPSASSPRRIATGGCATSRRGTTSTG